MDGIGRASVPLLSYFSGILFYVTLSTGGSNIAILHKKFLTLIWPMIFWSVPMLFIIAGEDILRNGAIDASRTPQFWVEQLFGFGSGPANSPLHFFREIFVMCIYTSTFLVLLKVSRPLAFLAAIAIAWFELREGYSAMARDHVFIFFSAGIAMAMAGRANWMPGIGAMGLVLAAYAILQVSGIRESAFTDFHAARLTMSAMDRIVMSLVMFWVSIVVVRRMTPIRNGAFWLEPRIFTVFCSHKITISVFGAAAFMFGLSENDPLYPVLFASQLVICIAVGVMIMPMLSWIPYVTGRRKKARRAAPVRAV